MNFSRTSWHIIFKLAVNENSIRRDGQRPSLHEPDVTVNTRAFVEPAFELRRVHLHGDDVFAADIGQVGDVVAETAVAAFVMAGEPAVDEHLGVAEHAVELQPDAFAGVGLRQIERAAIPRDVIGREARPDRMESVAAVRA